MIGPPSAYVIRRYATLTGLILAIIWIWSARGGQWHFPEYPEWTISQERLNHTSQAHVAAPDFPISTNDVFEFPPVDSESIKSVCGDIVWNSSVVFTCDNSVGGIGNIRNSILNCVRYAISAGASLVMPQVIVRNAGDISLIRTGERIEMEYLFDVPHFVESLRISCPGLQLYSKTDDIPGHSDKTKLISLLPESIVSHIPKTGLSHPEEWRGTFHTWLEQYLSPDHIKVVELGRSYLQYPIYSDGEGFATSFGSILKFREDVRILATTTLRGLGQKFNLALEDKMGEPILKNAFFGAHLRTEKDAREGWPAGDWKYSRFDIQTELYLQQSAKSNTSVIYVASGDLSEVAMFTESALAINKTVTTKFSVLSGKDLEELEALTWDQQALIDFLVMLKASDFAGVGHSSFAWNIALKRHLYAEEKNHLNGPQMLSDELSQIYGLPRGYPEYAACLWP